MSVACGWRHSIAADSAGVVYTFGWCKYGQLGHGDTTYAAFPSLHQNMAMPQPCDCFHVPINSCQVMCLAGPGNLHWCVSGLQLQQPTSISMRLL